MQDLFSINMLLVLNPILSLSSPCCHRAHPVSVQNPAAQRLDVGTEQTTSWFKLRHPYKHILVCGDLIKLPVFSPFPKGLLNLLHILDSRTTWLKPPPAQGYLPTPHRELTSHTCGCPPRALHKGSSSWNQTKRQTLVKYINTKTGKTSGFLSSLEVFLFWIGSVQSDCNCRTWRSVAGC